MTEIRSYHLSRVYAAGWNAGRRHPFDEDSSIVTEAEAINPYVEADERERWAQGFIDATSRQISTASGLRKPYRK